MPITLASGTRIMVSYASGDLKGNSFSNPWTFDDIATLGYCAKIGSNTFVFDTKMIYFAGGGTYFYAAKQNIIFKGGTGGLNNWVIYGDSTAYVKFGDVASGVYSNGCNFSFDFNSGLATQELDYTAIGSAEFYNCSFQSTNTGTNQSYRIRIGKAKFESCIFRNQSTIPFSAGSVGSILKGSIITDCYYGISPNNSLTTFESLTINKNTGGALFFPGGGDVTMRNIRITSDATNHIQQYSVNNQITNRFVDCDIKTNKINNYNYYSGLAYDHISIVELYNSIITKITDETGNSLNSASVRIYNKFNTLITDLTSDVQGLTASTDLKKYEDKCTRLIADNFAQVRTYTEFSPFTIVVTKSGYQTQTLKLTPSNTAINLVISLKANPAPLTFSITRLLSRVFASGKKITSHEIITEGTIEHEASLDEAATIINAARATYRPQSNDILIEQEVAGLFEEAEVISEGVQLLRASSSTIKDQEAVYVNESLTGEFADNSFEGLFYDDALEGEYEC